MVLRGFSRCSLSGSDSSSLISLRKVSFASRADSGRRVDSWLMTSRPIYFIGVDRFGVLEPIRRADDLLIEPLLGCWRDYFLSPLFKSSGGIGCVMKDASPILTKVGLGASLPARP